jgi:hypothetical protein
MELWNSSCQLIELENVHLIGFLGFGSYFFTSQFLKSLSHKDLGDFYFMILLVFSDILVVVWVCLARLCSAPVPARH